MTSHCSLYLRHGPQSQLRVLDEGERRRFGFQVATSPLHGAKKTQRTHAYLRRERERQTETGRETEADRHRERQTRRDTERETETERDKETERQREVA